MLIIGLTGSIGMGKSTAAKRFADNGVAVFDADAEVHRLYAGKAVPLIETAFPGTVRDGAVDRVRLAAVVVGDSAAMKRLEDIVHPLVREAERAFLAHERERGAEMAVLEIPLLFETGAESLVDVTVVVSAPEAVQRERVLARPGMTQDKFERLKAKQMPDDEKRVRADFVVDSSRPIAETGEEIDKLIESLRGRRGGAAWRLWQDADDGEGK